ncbi:unnamed protein product [Caenorhabditis angaria]|uniref:Uncharacterized protein n=1 Tax=Caenorhabditis angaria TaxID=860376 RepID=A0A9P1ITU9_9PELO|nr:unnamed protein product [Caenorhabditis angaria]
MGGFEDFCGGPNVNPFPTGLPNISVCFQHTLLVWIPTIFFLLTLPFFIAQCKLTGERFAKLPFSFAICFKLLCCALLSLNSIFVWFFVIFSSNSFAAAYFIYPFCWALVFTCTFLLHLVRLRCGVVTSGVQHLTAILFLLSGAPEFYQWCRNLGAATSSEPLGIAYLIYYSILLIYTFALCFADKRNPKEVEKLGAKNPSPELQSSFLNRLTLWWFNSVPFAGYKKDLELEDVFELSERSKTAHLFEMWKGFWEPKRLKYIEENSIWNKDLDEKGPPYPSVIATLFQMFKWEFMLASVLKFTSDTLQFASPFLLQQLLNFVASDHAVFWKGMSLSILMFSTSELRSLILNGYFYIMFRMGTKIQTALTAAVYNKTLILSNSARRSKTVGEIVNLMAIDVERFQMITPQIQQFWSCPYQIAFALIYLFFTLGYSALPGVVIMLIFVPMNIFSSIIVRKWQIEQMRLKDERTKMVNEILNGIKVVKLYAWEIPMEKHVEKIRNQELVLIKKTSMVRNMLDSFNTASPFLVALFSFGTFVLSNPSHELTPQIAFVSLALFNQLRSPMTMIALLIGQAVQAVVSNDRLKEFLVIEELDENAVQKSSHADRSQNAVHVENLFATWDETDETHATLEEVNLCAPRAGLISVVGKVGAGKSSLLNALLGEMTKLRGRIGVSGRVGYVPQQPWIQNMTLRDNITFGRPFDKKKYENVLLACALKSDISILPAGDLTEIGEKGINLSGGQKARVSLARAVYQDLDIYLLDDPLSAVDSHVGRHIFDKVIGPNGLLRSKTRILVTHGLTFTKFSDEILVLSEGCIEESGKYEELLEKRGTFWRFLEEYKSGSGEDEEEDLVRGIEEDLGKIELELKESPKFTTQISKLSEKSPESPETNNKIIEKERIAQGKVEIATYQLYIKAGTYTLSIAFLVLFILNMTCNILRSFWLSAWSDENEPTGLTPDGPGSKMSPNTAQQEAQKMSNGLRLGVYAALGFSEVFCFFLALYALVFVGQKASRNLHAPLIHNLLRSPMSFYDTTPLGRILNRCAKDIETIDMMMPLNFRYLIMCALQVFFTLLVIIISTPLFAIVIVPLGIVYLFFLRFYVPTARQLRRLESVHRSPIYSHFSETIQGAASIRAYNKVTQFCDQSGDKVDTFIRCRYTSLVANRWLAVRLEFVGNCIIFFAALFAVLSKEFGWITQAGIIGVSISYALNITEVLNFAVRQVSEIEANIVSVERVDEYTNTPNEAPWKIEGKTVQTGWPTNGIVKFDKYSTRYREGLDLVLHGISADVMAGEKIGIVGRTGAGKSSFALALFRMIEAAEGRIIIDGIDVSEIGLHDLRSNITIIPQDPVLFSGSLRFNLDPFSTYSDDELWTALELAHLKSFAMTLTNGLEYAISEAGENLSVGQRQLVALARALLRHTKVLVLDEATAAVDVATDSLIQETIRTEFRNCTVFTIAHRLNTIMDYDRIMVLDKGSIIEFDSPDTLMADKNSVFAKMVADSASNQKS